MRRLAIVRCAALLFAAVGPVIAQIDAAARAELEHVFDRPAGKTIGEEQKQRLAAWLAAQAGKDLGALGYVPALQQYLDRDYAQAVATLDAFFAKGHAIDNAEHRTMAGRIFLNAAATEGRAAVPDMQKLAHWGEWMARLYHDTAMLERMAKTIAQRAPDPAAFRVALARGVFASDLTAAQQDAFLQHLYGGGDSAPAAATAKGERRPVPAVAADAGGDVVQVGQPVGEVAIDRVVNGPAGFDLAAVRGKVVVLDFFASWCPPCRAAVPGLVELQRAHPDDVQVVGVTRYYGRGMDFSAADAKVPHGGKTVQDLGREQEAALYPPLVERFGIGYPIVFTADQELARRRFGVTGIPTLFVVGRDGAVVGKVVGAGEAQHEELLRLVEAALRPAK